MKLYFVFWKVGIVSENCLRSDIGNTIRTKLYGKVREVGMDAGEVGL